MGELEIVKNRAQKALTITRESNFTDKSFWDKTQRIVYNSRLIIQLPEVTQSELAVDRFSLIASAYFCIADLAVAVAQHGLNAEVCLSQRQQQNPEEVFRQVLEEYLNDILNSQKIDKITEIISNSRNHSKNSIEAAILSDAINLDDMGAVGLFNDFRRLVISGKGVSNAITSWQRKIDYGYWDARLKESFKFDSVREIAKKRLVQAGKFMKQLSIEQDSDDLEDLTGESVEIF